MWYLVFRMIDVSLVQRFVTQPAVSTDYSEREEAHLFLVGVSPG